MNDPVASILFAKAPSRSAVAPVCPLENSNRFNDVGDDGPALERRRFDRPAAAHAPASSRIETSGAPLWNGPRLRPVFVAQVIGQVTMYDRRRAARLAHAAYDRVATDIPAALLLDRKI